MIKSLPIHLANINQAYSVVGMHKTNIYCLEITAKGEKKQSTGQRE